MKLITAYIKPNMLNEVIFALHGVEGLTGASVSSGQGFGRHRMRESPGEVEREESNMSPHVRVEVACADGAAAAIVEAIQKHAHTGLHGDGLVCVQPLKDCVRICGGERGEAAL
ncbi:MAG: P-II family nitrogen regulator [Planctomycetota bacterium]|jgi:nitrogen regulatory protein PII